MKKLLLSHRSLLGLFFASFLTLMANESPAQDLFIDDNGWSVISPSSDSRIIYCSDAQGDDANDGLSEAAPVKTLDQALSLLRSGFPDHVYLKRGDTWTDQNLLALRSKPGRNGTERTVVAYYGSGNRPLIKVNNELFYNGDLDYLAIVGIEFYNYTADPNNPSFSDPEKIEGGIRTSGNFLNDVLIEDCKFSFFEDAIVMENNACNCGDANKNVDIRRNIIINAYARNSTTEKKIATGMFLSSMSDLLIEENFFDHNGWNEDLEDANANQFNHNVYLSNASSGPTVVRGNVLSRGAAHGVQLRSGGTAVKNAFIGNAVGMNLGYSTPPVYYQGLTVADDNVFTDGRPQIPNDLIFPQTGAIWGLWKQLIDSVTVNNNIVANLEDDRGGNVRPYEGELRNAPNALGTDNIGWNWNKESFPATDPGWTDPTRDKESFVASLGYANYEAWVEAAINREIKSWPSELTAYDYVDYIRAGFDKPAVERPYGGDTPGDTIFASEVIAFAQGKRKNGRSVVAERSDPLLALGAPQENDEINFVALGFGGSLTLKLDRPIADGPGADLRVVETSFNDTNRPCEAYPERADVAVSSDGVAFVTVVEAGCQEIEVDLSDAGLSEVQYVRITDVSDPSRFNGNADGYDVDGVMQIVAGSPNARNAGFVAKANYAPDEVSEKGQTAIRMYPNPVTDALYVTGASEAEITVYDAQGVAVLRQAKVSGREALDIGALRSGLYLVKVIDGQGIRTVERIIKQ